MKRIIIPALAAMALAGCEYIPGTDAHMVAQAKAQVAAELKDPTSPLFTQIKVVEDGVCGQVNGKNSFGAYAGNEPFVWRKNRDVMVGGEEHPTNVGITAANQCRLRVLYAACQAGQSTLTASIQASSECSEVGQNALRDQLKRGY